MKELLLWIYDCWNSVMNAKYNPLKYIPNPSLQAYFMIVLFVMWAFFFGIIAAYWGGWFGYYNSFVSLIVHLSIIIPLWFTWAIFEDARRDGHTWYIQLRNKENKPLASAGEERSKTKHMDSIL